MPNAEGMERAAALLRAGSLVAIPTETVYGLAARADDDDAVRGIYLAKGRPAHNPLIVHVADGDEAPRWAARWPAAAALLAGRFWPGPLTLVVEAGPGLSSLALAGGRTVGLRAPAHPVAQALLRAVGLPLAAPSANPSSAISPTRPEHVLEGLDGKIAAVLDGGPCAVGIESTVLDLTEAAPVVRRPGGVSREALAAALGAPVALAEGADGDGPLRSPGLLARHYAPRIPLRLAAREELAAAREAGAFVIGFGEGAGHATLPGEPAGAAAMLYEVLHRAEQSGAPQVVVEHPPAGDHWEALRDRLRRASVPGEGD